MSTIAGQRVAIAWAHLRSEQGSPMLWLGSWLVGDQGEEGAWFYSGRGGERVAAEPPPGATGIRIYRWANEGLDPEYVDLELGDPSIDTATLDFDRPQRFSRLALAREA